MRTARPRCSLAVAAGVACFALAPAAARASDPSEAQVQMRAAMTGWFGGEKQEALVFLGVGVASAAAGGVLVSRSDTFARSAGATVGTVGVVQAAVALYYYLSIDGRVAKLTSKIDADPAGFRREELRRLAGINDRFVLFRYAELALMFGAVTVAAAGAASDKQAMRGVGLGISLEAASYLLLDGFAEARAHVYTEHLQRVPVSGFVAPTASPGVVAGVRGLF
jgi:hypothetical protein